MQRMNEKYKIFVVDDEPFICHSIKKMIETLELNCTVIGMAYDGKTAYEKIKECVPDILLTDIKMPFQSGLDLIKQMKQNGLPTECVVLSGYNEFSLAQEAIRLGICDYLLKPLSFEELEETLTRVISNVKKKNYDMKRSYLESLLLTKSVEKEPVKSAKFWEHFCFVGLVQYGASNGIYDYESKEIQQFWENDLPQEDCVWEICGCNIAQKIIIIQQNELEEQSAERTLHEIYEKITEKSQTVTVVYSSRIIHSEEDLLKEIEKMREYADYKAVFGTNNFLKYEDTTIELSNRQSLIKDVLLSVKQNIERQNINDFLEECIQVLRLCERNQFSKTDIDIVIRNLLEIISSETKYEQTIGKKMFYVQTNDVLMKSHNYKSLQDHLMAYIKQIISYKDVIAMKTEKEMFQLIVDFIDENFFCDLSINLLTSYFGISKNKLWNMFKKYQHTNFSEYLTNKRIEEAKKIMLRYPHIYMKQVSQSVGYEDPFYFSRIFKEKVGVAPSEYYAFTQEENQDENV